MVQNDIQNELAEGFEPTALPPPGPDGSLELPPMRKERPVPPRLCEQGPCRHYHSFKIQLDAATPIAIKGPDGELVVPEKGPDHTETHHYCYPDVGIESKLGSLPVIQCNRWSPIGAEEKAAEEARLEQWIGSEPGQKFTAELAAWQTANDELAAEEAKAIEAAAADLAQMPAPVITVWIEAHSLAVAMQCAWTETVGDVIARAFIEQIADGAPIEGNPSHYSAHLQQANTPRSKWPRLDPTHTLSHAGITDGERIVLIPIPIPSSENPPENPPPPITGSPT